MVKWFLKLKNRKLIKEFYGLEVDPRAVAYFRREVGDNRTRGNVEIINKIRRNFLIGRTEYEKDGWIYKSCGNLLLKAYGNKIVSLENRKGYHRYIHNRKNKKILDRVFDL